MLDHPDIRERENGMLPVSVINKSFDNRMVSTIRHNRARGSHDVDLMSNIVKELHELGCSDAWCLVDDEYYEPEFVSDVDEIENEKEELFPV